MIQILKCRCQNWISLVVTFMLVTTSQANDANIPTYSHDIAPMIYSKCVECHREGESSPFHLTNYDEIKERAETILAVIEDGYMPPWPPSKGDISFDHDRSLTQKQIATFHQWVIAGKPMGETDAIPSLPEFPEKWRLGKPDLVVTMPEAYSVPADGPDIYRNFVVPLDLSEETWIKAIELRPQARSVVHHVLFFLDSSGTARKLDERTPEPGFSGMGFPVSGRLGGYVPGSTPNYLPKDLAMKIPAGSDLILQTHFHPTGKPEVEQAEIALYFADRAPSQLINEIQIPPRFGATMGINIPAGEKDYQIIDSFELPIAIRGFLISGHAHYVCKSMKMEATFPTGQEKMLLNIEDWDLNWQGAYQFEEELPLPAGTVLKTTLIYDNSDENARNPFSPPQQIRWGRESTDEMGSITLYCIAEHEEERGPLNRALRNHQAETVRTLGQRQMAQLQGAGGKDVFNRLDKNGDEKLQKSELPPLLASRIIDRFDADKDGAINLTEAVKVRDYLQQLNQGLGERIRSRNRSRSSE